MMVSVYFNVNRTKKITKFHMKQVKIMFTQAGVELQTATACKNAVVYRVNSFMNSDIFFFCGVVVKH